MKYHINPETGKPGQCTATVRDCKYAVDGAIPVHYDSKDDARVGYEKAMESKQGANKTLNKKGYSGLKKTELISYMDNSKLLADISDEKLNQYMDMVPKNSYSSMSSSAVKNIVNNENASDETLERVANDFRVSHFANKAIYTDNQRFIEKLANSSRAHNRNVLFENENVSNDTLYGITKKFSNAKYSKDKIKQLQNAGYDMSHVNKASKSRTSISNSKDANIKPTSNVDEAFDNITQQMNQLDKDKLVRLSQREGIKIPPAYKKMLETGNYDTKSTKGKISVIDTFTRAKFVTEGRRAFTGTGDSNDIARHIISIGKMPRETKEEQAKVIKEYNRINSMIDGQIEFHKGRQERLRERKLKVAQGKIRIRD